MECYSHDSECGRPLLIGHHLPAILVFFDSGERRDVCLDLVQQASKVALMLCSASTACQSKEKADIDSHLLVNRPLGTTVT